MKIYLIIHEFDKDGGFGDAVSCREVLGAFTDKAKAEEYAERWDTPTVYWRPYADLYYHGISVEEVDVDALQFDVDPVPQNPAELLWVVES